MKFKNEYFSVKNNCFIFGLAIFGLQILLNGCKINDESKDNIIKIELPDKIDGDSIIADGTIIKLETKDDVLLGFLMDVKVKGDTVYILDQFFKRLYLFSLNGKYINKIENLGKGPYEYIGIIDFAIYENEIYLLAERKIIVFDIISLKAKNEIQLDFYAHSLMIGRENIILSTSNFDSGYILNYISKKSMKNKKYMSSNIKSEDNSMGLIYAGYKFRSIPNEGKSLFYYTFSDLIYTVSDSGYQCAYQIDLKDKRIPIGKLTINPQTILEYTEHEEHMMIYNCFQNGSTLAICLNSNLKNNVDGKAYLIKNNNSTSYYNSIIEKSLDLPIRIMGSYTEGFIGFISSEVLEMRKYQLSTKKEKGEELNYKEKNFLDNYIDNSNPYLVVFNFIDKL